MNRLQCRHCGTDCGDSPYVLSHHPCRVNQPSQESVTEMANVILCDRCGSIATAKVAGGCIYWPKPPEVVQYNETPTPEEKYILCPPCAEALYDFLHSPDKDVRAIMQAFDPRSREETDPHPNQAETSRAALDAEFGND